MTNLQAKLKMKEYLKAHFMEYQEDIEDGVSRYTILLEGYDSCPDKVLEACVWFYPEFMECRVYYDCNASKWCKKSEYRGELLRLLNYCNANVWICTNDGMDGALYRPNYLYTPRFYITEDGCFDITMTSIIPLELYEMAPLETEDYFMAACPELLDRLSVPIFFVLAGRINVEQAISMVRAEIFGESKLA